jgi:predicted transcriptional regulator
MDSLPSDQAILSTVIRELMQEQGIEAGKLAERCAVSYQTIKNVLDGGSPSARLISSLVSEFGLRKKQTMLRRLLIGFIRGQFEAREGTVLLKTAELIVD